MEPADRVKAGAAVCALCGDTVRPTDDAFITPDFVASDQDPDWRFADVPVHRACFMVWERRKAFCARFNRLARHLLDQEGWCPFLTGDGHLVRRAWRGSHRPRRRTA
jgi:hypothetical protein